MEKMGQGVQKKRGFHKTMRAGRGLEISPPPSLEIEQKLVFLEGLGQQTLDRQGFAGWR